MFKRSLCGLIVLLAASTLFAVGQESTPDFIFYNGSIVTMVDPDDVHQALAVSENRILAVGDDTDVLPLADSTTRLVDLNGAAVYPGFIDPHTHLLNDSWNRDLSPIESQDLALSYGITSATNMYTTPDLVETYLQMATRGDMRVRFSLYLIYNTSCGDVLGDWYTEYEPLVELAPRLQIGGVKIFSETSVCGDDLIGLSFTSELRAVLSPGGIEWYGSNRPLFSEDELTGVVQVANDHGFPVAIHAIGDGGVQRSLDALEEVLDGTPNNLRHAILHNLFIRDDQLSKYTDLGIVAVVESMSSCFANFYRELLPAPYKHIVRRWADLVATGAHVAADSDWPWSAEEAINPLFRLQALMSPVNFSQSYSDWEPCGLLPEDQLLSAWQGLRMMTTEAAYMLHRDHDLGTLEAGKLADLVILSEDPQAVAIEALTEIKVLLTVVDGRIEYRAGRLLEVLP